MTIGKGKRNNQKRLESRDDAASHIGRERIGPARDLEAREHAGGVARSALAGLTDAQEQRRTANFFFSMGRWYSTTGLDIVLKCFEEGAPGYELLDLKEDNWHPRGSRAKTLWDCLWLKGDYLKIRSSNNMLHLIESDDADMIPRLRPKARPSRSKSRSRAGRVVDGSGAM